MAGWWPSKHEGLSLTTTVTRHVAAHTSDPGASEVVKGGSRDHHLLSGELEASLSYMKFCLKEKHLQGGHPYLDLQGKHVTKQF